MSSSSPSSDTSSPHASSAHVPLPEQEGFSLTTLVTGAQMLFVAYNPTDKPMTAQAIPSVAPSKAAAYFHKTECFCFTQQVLQPGERIEMPVRFIVDRDLPADVRHLTLAYTLFDITVRKPPVAQATLTRAAP